MFKVEDLLLEYKQTAANVTNKMHEIQEEIELLKGKIKPGDKSKSIEYRLHIKDKIKNLKVEKSLYSSCKSDLEYSIYWMEHGHPPGSSRGIERRAIYEREKPFDPMMMQRYFRSNQPEYPWDHRPSYEPMITNDERELIEISMQGLTEREREVYIMARANSMSQQRIAELLFVTRNTVKTVLYRAERKVRKNMALINDMEE